MNVEKFRFTKDDSEYTTFPNALLQGISNPEVLGLYVYMASLPPDWIFIKEHLKSHFSFGRDKLDKILTILEEHNLIKTFQEKNEKGRFTNWCMHVNNPRSFLPFTDFQGTEQTSVNTTSAPCPENPCYGKPVTGKQQLQKKYKKTNKKTKKTKSFYAQKSRRAENEKKHSFADSMDQMANEKKHISKHEELKTVERTPMPLELKQKLGLLKK